jgi:phage-related protein
MPTIGGGCHELRIVDRNATWRIVYFLAQDVVVILDVFSTKTKETPKPVIEVCKMLLQAYRTFE